MRSKYLMFTFCLFTFCRDVAGNPSIDTNILVTYLEGIFKITIPYAKKHNISEVRANLPYVYQRRVKAYCRLKNKFPVNTCPSTLINK